MNVLCEDIVRFMKMKAKPGVEVLFDRHLPECRIVSDRNRLNQVIANFVNNAIKFTTAGSIRVGYDKVDETHLRFMWPIRALALSRKCRLRYSTVL